MNTVSRRKNEAAFDDSFLSKTSTIQINFYICRPLTFEIKNPTLIIRLLSKGKLSAD